MHFNNPVIFTDPDGRRPEAGQSGIYYDWDENRYIDMNTGAASTFEESMAYHANNSMKSNYMFFDFTGGGGSASFLQDIFGSGGSVKGLFSLRDQLIKAGFGDKPENTKASFEDWAKLVNSEDIPALNDLYRMMKTKIKFYEDANLNSPGATTGEIVWININKNKNILYYAFTIGHEMYGHVFSNMFFKTKFSEITGIPESSPRTFKFFQEVMGVSWEIEMGETRYGNKNALEAAEIAYGGIGHGQSMIDTVKKQFRRLKYEWNLEYNIQKNKLK